MDVNPAVYAMPDRILVVALTELLRIHAPVVKGEQLHWCACEFFPRINYPLLIVALDRQWQALPPDSATDLLVADPLSITTEGEWREAAIRLLERRFFSRR